MSELYNTYLRMVKYGAKKEGQKTCRRLDFEQFHFQTAAARADILFKCKLFFCDRSRERAFSRLTIANRRILRPNLFYSQRLLCAEYSRQSDPIGTRNTTVCAYNLRTDCVTCVCHLILAMEPSVLSYDKNKY